MQNGRNIYTNQYPSQPYPNGYVYQYPPQPKQVNGLAVASLVTGLLSVLTCFIFFLSIPLGIVGISLGCAAQSKGPKSGLAVAGIVLGVAGVVLTAFFYLMLLLSETPLGYTYSGGLYF